MKAKPARKMTSTTPYMASGWVRSTNPNSLPRGTAWMPSSPPVNLACRLKKYTICASASVIIAK